MTSAADLLDLDLNATTHTITAQKINAKRSRKMMTYKEYIQQLKANWNGAKVWYYGAEYKVIDVDYNGYLLIDKPAQYTSTTAVELHKVIKMEDENND